MRDVVRLVVSVAIGVTLFAFAIYVISIIVMKLGCVLFGMGC